MRIQLSDANDRVRFQPPCAAFIHDDADGLILLELTGADSENRAVWSHLVKRRTERSLVETHATFVAAGFARPIQVIPTTKYHSVPGAGRLTLLHSGLTQYNRAWLLGGSESEPSPWFLAGLQRTLPLPILPHWAPVLWQAAIADKLLAPASTVFAPISAWQLRASSEGTYFNRWVILLTRLVHKRQLSVEASP